MIIGQNKYQKKKKPATSVYTSNVNSKQTPLEIIKRGLIF